MQSLDLASKQQSLSAALVNRVDTETGKNTTSGDADEGYASSSIAKIVVD